MRRSLACPDALLATWFGAGRAPIAPGTVGSLATFPLALPIAYAWGWIGLLVAGAIVAAVGVWAAGAYGIATAQDDPGEVVIDEVAAQLLVLAAAPFEALPWIAAFLVFRVFDVLKPWPCDWLDRRLHGGVGVMADDLAAAAYGAAVIGILGELGTWR